MNAPHVELALAQAVARSIRELTWSSLSTARRQRVARSVTDFIACAIGGADRPELGPALLLAGSGPFQVPGQSAGFDAAGATLVFGMAGALLQLHDAGFGGSHPCLGIIPAAWVAWQHGETRVPVEVFLGAVAAGYEVVGRIGAVASPQQFQRGFTPTATMGAIGGAVSAGLMLGLDENGLARAISNAAMLCPMVPYEALCGHGALTPIHGAAASRAGLEAAMLAGAGYTAGPCLLEGNGALPGFLAMLGADPHALEPETWDGGMLDHVRWKMFPSCGACHRAVEAALRLGPIDIEQIVDLEIRVPPSSMQLGGRGPSAGSELYDCIMSTRWTVVAALADGAYGPVSLPRLGVTSAAMQTLLNVTRVVADSTLDAQEVGGLDGAKLLVQLKDGTSRHILHCACAGPSAEGWPRGSLTDCAEAALDEKFAVLTSGHVAQAAALRAKIMECVR